jgi:Protein of unknown function (DUF3349)
MVEASGEASSSAKTGLIERVVAWLRAGYPQGVPQQDYVALLGILQRALTPTELDLVVLELSDRADEDGPLITKAMVQERIEDLLKGPSLPEDVTRVSARLAAAGWPLWSPESSSDGEGPQVRPGLVSRVVDWLRQGYPTGLPVQDFIPLIALLRRRLTDAEVGQVAEDLVENGFVPADRIDVGAAITKVTSELPSDEDVQRVRAYLVGHDWPTDFAV